MQKRTEDDDFTNAHMPPWPRHETDEMCLARCGIVNMMGASEKTAEEVVSEYEENKKRWWSQKSHGCWQPDCEPVEPGAIEHMRSKKVSPGPQEPMPTRPPPKYHELTLKKASPAMRAAPAVKAPPADIVGVPPVARPAAKAPPVKALAVKAPPSAAKAAPPVKAPPADIVGVPPVKARPAAKAPPVKALPAKAPPVWVKAPPARPAG